MAYCAIKTLTAGDKFLHKWASKDDKKHIHDNRTASFSNLFLSEWKSGTYRVLMISCLVHNFDCFSLKIIKEYKAEHYYYLIIYLHVARSQKLSNVIPYNLFEV